MDLLSGTRITIQKTSDPTDLEWCAGLMADNEPWITLKRNYDKCLLILLDPLGEVYLMQDGDTRVGFVIIKLKGAFTGYLQTIAIDEKYRGKGIGEAVIQYMEELIFNSFSNVYICASSFNLRAQRLYERLGYEKIGVLKDLVERGYDEILMRKTRGPMNEFNKY
jgi:ribosomal protein S18 acetylase RimI-like enzyme